MKKYQQLNHLTTTEVSDALDSLHIKGVLYGIKPLKEGLKVFGPAYTIEYEAYEEKPLYFKNAANYIDSVPAEAVIIIDNKGREDCTVWGSILTETAIYKKIAGTVVHGSVRDIAAIKKFNYPLYCKNFTMRSGKNRVYKKTEQAPLLIEEIVIRPNDLIFADDNGVLVIPMEFIDEIILRAERIRHTEEKIKKAVLSGLPLAEARKLYHYDRPWVADEN